MSNSTNHSKFIDWLAWAQLVRLSAVPTAATNVLAGYLIAFESWQPWQDLVLLCVSSCLLYASGMVLNDFSDHLRDKQTSPCRPIPSNRVSRRAAGSAYLVLTLGGLFTAWLVCRESFAVAGAIAAAVIAYNRILKSTVFAAPAMGLCRTLNIVLGASSQISFGEPLLGLPVLVWWIALSLGVLITGLTTFAREERSKSDQGRLLIGAAVMAIGLMNFCFAAIFLERTGQISPDASIRYLVLLGLIAIPGIWRTACAVRSSQGKDVRLAVKSIIRSLIFLDAVVCFLIAPDQPFYAIVVVLFLFPVLLLSRQVSST